MGEMELIGSREDQPTHADGDGEEVGAMAASHRHSLEQARARHAHLNIYISQLEIRFQ